MEPATSGGVIKSGLEPINEHRPHQIRQDMATSTMALGAQEGAAGLRQLGQGGRGTQSTQGADQPAGQDALLSGGETPSCCLLLTLLTLCHVVHCIDMMETLLY